jgi:chromosome segregation ATPase
MSDMKLDEAVSTVARFAKMFEAVQVLASEIDSVGKVKQLGDEAQARLDGYAEKEAAAKASLDAVNAKVDAAIKREADSAGKIMADANAEAARTIEKARFEAQSILDQAGKIAADTRAKANTYADPIIAQAAKAASDWSDLDAKLTAGKKELQELQAKIDQARETISQLMRV